MKDILVFTADADALAVMTSVLERHQSLGTRRISFLVDRHPYRDPGMVKTGADLAKLWKGEFDRALLIWDHHGCGREGRNSPDECAKQVQQRLDDVSWKNRSAAVVIVPELEEWLWHNVASFCSHFGITQMRLNGWVDDFANSCGLTSSAAVAERPKELFEFICLKKLRRTISPADFRAIARRASLTAWRRSGSFRQIVTVLRTWFPPASNNSLGGAP